MLLGNLEKWCIVLQSPLMSAFMLTYYMDLCTCSFVFSIPMWFRCSCFSVLTCSSVGIIITLPFIAMSSMTAFLSLDDQYRCMYFCTSALLRPQSTCYDSMSMYSSPSIANLIFSSIMQSDTSVHNSAALMLMHMPGITLPSCFVVVWIASL